MSGAATGLADGLHIGIPDAEYHADPAPVSLSSSVAKLLLTRSPRHAYTAHPRLNPDWKPDDEATAEQDMGHALHRMILEGADEGDGTIVVVDADSWRTKAAQEARDAARAAGAAPLLRGKYEAAHEITCAVRDQLELSELAGVLDDGEAEVTGVWTERDGFGRDVRCRLRADWLTRDKKIALDLKTTSTNAHPDVFARQIVQMGYGFQSAWYTRGLRAVGGVDPQLIFVVVEVSPPYALSLISLPPGWIEMERRRCSKAMNVWSECLRTGVWPSYPRQICWPELPAWAEAQYTEHELREMA